MRCSVSHEPETQRHTPHAFVVGGLHFATLGHLQRRKCQTSLLSWTWWNERAWRSIAIQSFVFLVLQILRSTTGRRQWFLISLSRPACRAWWTSELQIIHLTKVRSPNIRKHDVSVLIFHRLWTCRAQVIYHNAERQIKQNHCPLDFLGFSAYVVVRRKMCATKEMHFYKLWESHLPRKQKSFVWFV